ncbi:MAG: hypothetical protein H0U70_12780 [Tatlockia sp.]|nr:hypothetical protein [Tatlockia sp.]
MLITKEPGPEKKIQFRLRMNESVFNEITEYCQWAGIGVRDFFIEQSCKYIFNNDKDWKLYKEQQTSKDQEQD